MLERTVASVEAARRRAQEFQRKEVAPLKLGLAPSISVSLFMDPIAETAALVPGLQVELKEDHPEKLVDLLLSGDINAAIVGNMQDVPARIDHWPLFEERYVAIVAPGHQFANRSSIGVDDLRQTIVLERVGCDVAPKFQRSFFADCEPRFGHGSEHELHLQYMAAAGFGILLAPEHMPRLPALKTIPIEGDPVWREVHLLTVQGRHYSPALDAFVKIARLRDWAIQIGRERESSVSMRPERLSGFP